MSESTSTTGSFLKGAMGGLFNGGLMAGIFYGIAIGAQLLGHAIIPLHGAGMLGMIGSVLPMVGLMMVAVGIFSGVMGVVRANEEKRAAQSLARDLLREEEESRAPQLALQQEVAAGQAPATRWADRVGTSEDRIQSILNNGSMSSQDRAAAILAERDAQASNIPNR